MKNDRLDDKLLQQVSGASTTVPDSKYEIGWLVEYRNDEGKIDRGRIKTAYYQASENSWMYTTYGNAYVKYEVLHEGDIIRRLD